MATSTSLLLPYFSVYDACDAASVIRGTGGVQRLGSTGVAFNVYCPTCQDEP